MALLTIPPDRSIELFNGLRTEYQGREFRNRVQQNQNERYHRLPAASVPDAGSELPDLYVDFKRPVAIPTHLLYDQARAGRIQRRALIPYGYTHQLIHRFFAFQARVGLD